MVPFRYLAVTDEAAARQAATPSDARMLAGGTTLLDLMKLHVERPSTVVDINALPLARIEELPGGRVRVGALVRNSDMANHDLIRLRFPMVSQALLAGASGQLRNMATTGGNLLQRTRCYYFRDTASPCNKREPGSGCAALDGYNRIHAVLGTSDQCIATHASDLCVALAALDAVVRIRGNSTERYVPFADFHLPPGAHPERETVVGPGDLIMAVDIPPLAFATRSVYVKVRDRASYAFALASAAVALDLQEGTIRDARIALGGVATTPWRARNAEQVLIGRRADETSYRAAAEAALEGAVPRAHNAFKIELAKRTLVRALGRAGALA
jgi:xanthine dehydrogenase YagS FAD-binding subunit